MASESVCQFARSWGGRGYFSPAFSGEVYDFYSVSPEYFGFFFVVISECPSKAVMYNSGEVEGL
jgi:hypothetical protein